MKSYLYMIAPHSAAAGSCEGVGALGEEHLQGIGGWPLKRPLGTTWVRR